MDSITAERFQLTGSRVGFVFHVTGFSNGSETDVGWFGTNGGGARFGLINAGENAMPGDPLLPEDNIGFAIAPDGSVALMSGSACQVIALLPTRADKDKFGRLLGPPSVLFTARHGGLDPASIALSPEAVSWRDASGTTGSAPLTTSSPPPGPSGGC